MPTFLSIEPANYCQLHCPECPVGMRMEEQERQRLSIPLYQKILKEASPWVHTIQFYFQGEPLLNPHLPEMIRLAHAQKIYTIVSTNGQNLTQKMANDLLLAGLSRIIVSIDGLSEESYAAYRKGGSLHKALAGLGYLRNAKLRYGVRTTIELQCLCLRSNEHEWNMFKRSYRRMGADCLTLKTAQFYEYEDGNEQMPHDERYCRYVKGKDGKYRPKNRIKHHQKVCRRLYMGAVIDSQGKMLPCCFDKEKNFPLGDLQKTSLRACWTCPDSQQTRRTLMQHKHTIPMCQNCTE